MEGLDPLHGRQCTAKSKRSQQQCKRLAIPGGRVCVMHGGKAPQVQKAARDRLAALVDPAIAQLQALLTSENDGVSLSAVKDVLDRNGFKPKDTTVLEGAITIDQVLDAKQSLARLLSRLAERDGASAVAGESQ